MGIIEVGAPPDAGDIVEEAKQDAGRQAEVNRQRRERRSQPKVDEVHRVNRRLTKPGTIRDAASVREVDTGPKRQWRPAYSLPSFKDPPGYSLCWIARHARRHGDEANLLASLRQGWEFVKPEDIEERDLPTETLGGRLGRYGEVIGDDTTVLMKLPLELKRQRDKHYNEIRDRATRAVTAKHPGLPEANPKMPLVEDRNEHSSALERSRIRRSAKPDGEE